MQNMLTAKPDSCPGESSSPAVDEDSQTAPSGSRARTRRRRGGAAMEVVRRRGGAVRPVSGCREVSRAGAARCVAADDAVVPPWSRRSGEHGRHASLCGKGRPPMTLDRTMRSLWRGSRGQPLCLSVRGRFARHRQGGLVLESGGLGARNRPIAVLRMPAMARPKERRRHDGLARPPARSVRSWR